MEHKYLVSISGNMFFISTCMCDISLEFKCHLLVNRMIWRCLVCGLQNDVQFLRMNKLNFLFFFFYKWNIEIRCLFYSYRKLQFYIYWCKSSPQKTKFRKPDARIWYFRLGLVATIKVWYSYKWLFTFKMFIRYPYHCLSLLFLCDYAWLNMHIALFEFHHTCLWFLSSSSLFFFILAITS
jgi:hypothetical protein